MSTAKKTRSPKKGKKETKSPKKENQGGNERVRMTGDEDTQYLEVDKYAIRRARGFLAVDADGDEQVALEEILSVYENSEVFYMKYGTCTRFYSNPLKIEENRRRDTWVRQVRPCGYYKEIYSDIKCSIPKDFVTIDANTDYPGSGALGDIVLDDLYLVKFDVGRHPGQPASCNNNIDFSAINFNEIEGGVGDPSDFMKPNVEGETCLETFIFGGDSFGELHGNNGNCMGYCGSGCWAFGSAYDCMKHDTCSYYKTMVQGSGAEGFFLDVDCGDEAAQATINCWDKNGWRRDIPAICEFDNKDVYAEMNRFGRTAEGGRQGLLARTGRDRGQGMPHPWNYPDGPEPPKPPKCFLDPVINCGGHTAPTCSDCPYQNGRNYGESWCNGECSWDTMTETCI